LKVLSEVVVELEGLFRPRSHRWPYDHVARLSASRSPRLSSNRRWTGSNRLQV